MRTYGLLGRVAPAVFLGSAAIARLTPTVAEYAWLAPFLVQRLGQHVSQRALPDRRRSMRTDVGTSSPPG